MTTDKNVNNRRRGHLQRADDPSTSLQGLTRNSSEPRDPGAWSDKFDRTCNKICRVELESGRAVGSGFLVDTDKVLTNWHVAECITDPDSIILRFDYVEHDGRESEGRECRLAENWLLLASEPTPRERNIDEGPEEPTSEYLDFALLQLREQVGEDYIQNEKRGWISNFSSDWGENDVVKIFQHPDGRPLKFTDGVISAVNSTHTRIFYTASTEQGSSGSPCFDGNLDVVAIHHAAAGDLHNRGVPINLIMDQIKEKYGPLRKEPSIERTEDLRLSVVVIMRSVNYRDAGRQDTDGNREVEGLRHAILFHRVKHHLEKSIRYLSLDWCGRADRRVQFTVKRASIDEVGAGGVLRSIAEADLVIALVTQPDATIQYQLGFRDAVRADAILLYTEHCWRYPQQYVVPKHFPDHLKIEFDEPSPDQDIESYKRDGWYGSVIRAEPNVLYSKDLQPQTESLIEQSDWVLRENLNSAIQRIDLGKFSRPPDVFSKAGMYRPPEDLMKQWRMLFPSSVLRMRWKRKSGRKYSQSDVEEDLVVCDANEGFKNLFCLGDADLESGVLDFTALMGSVSNFLCPELIDDLKVEQADLRNRMVFADEDIVAKTPMKFKDGPFGCEEVHGQEHVRGSTYLPVLSAKRTIGDLEKSHSTYFVIVFIKQPDAGAIVGA